MRKKYMIAAGVTIFVILAASGGALTFWKYKQHQKKSVANASTETTDGTTLGLSSENANSGTTSLSQQQQTAANTEGANNQGNSLQTNLGQQQSSSSNSNGSSGSSSNIFDPSTFGQYDQYKNGTAARYADFKVGDGAEAVNGKKAVVVYRGWLTNGTLFDESKTDPKTGKYNPFTFALTDGSQPSSVIAGWQEGISGMKVGGERLLIIPPAVGYGSTAHPPIPANSVLVFDVLLAAVQ